MTPNDRNQDKNQAEAAPKHRWGARFKAAREALNLTEKDVAQRLHLKPNLITIIEAERFESGPPPIFMRGYIRSYGRLLNLPEKEITQALSQLNLANPASAMPSPVMRSHMQAQQNSHSGWSTILVVVVLVGLVGMWWNNHSRNSVKDTMNTAAMQPAEPIAPVAINNPAPPVANPAAPQTPADPMPTELASKTPAAADTTTPTTAVNAASNAPAPAPATTTPANTTPATPVASTDSTTPSNADTTPATKTEANSEKPATTDAANTTATDGSAVADKAIQAALENSDEATETHKPKAHIAKARGEVTSDDMEVPEQGLDTEDNNN